MYEKAESVHPSYKNLNIPFIKCTCEKRSTGSMCTLYFILFFLIFFNDSWWVLKHYIPARRIVFRRKGRNINRRHCSIKPEWESGPWCIVEWVASIHHLRLSLFCPAETECFICRDVELQASDPLRKFCDCKNLLAHHACLSTWIQTVRNFSFDILNVSWNKCALYSIMRQHLTWCLEIMIYLFDRTTN